MGGSLPITAYVRTMNEASRIEAVVRRAKESCSEVLVVDSGSTDSTVALAEAAGARVIVQPWLGNGRQKRVAEAEATDRHVGGFPFTHGARDRLATCRRRVVVVVCIP